MEIKWDKIGLFVGGMLAATKGVELLKSKEARTVAVRTTALALRGRDEVLNNVTLVRENCEDIYAEAVEWNEKKAADKAACDEACVIEDEAAAEPTEE